MSLFSFARLWLYLCVGAIVSVVESIRSAEPLGALGLRAHIEPSSSQRLPELCFVVAKIAYKSMCEFNEKLDIKDLRNYKESYLNNENHLDISNESYEEFLNKMVIFGSGRDSLSNVLTSLSFSEFFGLYSWKCSAELVLIAEIIRFLAHSDNGVGYLTFYIHKLKTKIDFGLLAHVVSHGQVVCGEDFVAAINEFGKNRVKDWQNVSFGDGHEENNKGPKDALMMMDGGSIKTKRLVSIPRMKNFTIRNEEKWLNIFSEYPLYIFLVHALFPLLQKEVDLRKVETFMHYYSYRYMILYKTMLAYFPSEFVRMIINSVNFKDLWLSLPLQTTFLNLSPSNQALFESKILPKIPETEREKLRPDYFKDELIVIKGDKFKFINLFLNSHLVEYEFEIWNDRILFTDFSYPNENDGVVLVRRRLGKYESTHCVKCKGKLSLDLVEGDEFFLRRGIGSDEVLDGLYEILDTYPGEMLYFMLDMFSFDYFKVVGSGA